MRGYECKLHLSQKLSTKFPSTRSIPIMSSSSAIGVIIASGNMGKTLAIKNNVFVSADAGLSWHQILKGSHYFNMGDHGGELFASFFCSFLYHYITCLFTFLCPFIYRYSCCYQILQNRWTYQRIIVFHR